MKKLTMFLSLSLSASLICCAVLAYFWIDRSISLSYLRQSYETERSSVEDLQKLIASEWKGLPEGQVQRKLEQAAAKMPERRIVVKKEGSIIWFDQVPFNIEQGRLESVGSTTR